MPEKASIGALQMAIVTNPLMRRFFSRSDRQRSLSRLITRTQIAINSPPLVRGQIYEVYMTFVFSSRLPAPNQEGKRLDKFYRLAGLQEDR